VVKAGNGPGFPGAQLQFWPAYPCDCLLCKKAGEGWWGLPAADQDQIHAVRNLPYGLSQDAQKSRIAGGFLNVVEDQQGRLPQPGEQGAEEASGESGRVVLVFR
jgi:hypothetical protein